MTLEIPELVPCPVCAYLSGTAPCAFVTRGAAVSAFLNRTQYEPGALLVVSNMHVTSVLDAHEELICQVYLQARRLARVLVELLQATGVSIFQNNGVASGQTIPHYHVHVVPRYPSSEPGRIFREREFRITPHAELEALAQQLRAGAGNLQQ